MPTVGYLEGEEEEEGEDNEASAIDTLTPYKSLSISQVEVDVAV